MIKKSSADKPGISEGRDRLLSKDYILLMFSSSVHALMNQFFLVAAPLYIYKLGGTTLQAGLLSTVYSMTALAARPISGVLSDRSGRVRLLIFGSVLSAVTCSMFGFTAVLPLLLIIRGVTGIGFGAHSTCAGAAAADVLPKSRLAEGIGYFGLYATLAQAIGPGIALAIVAGDTLGSYRALFLLTAALCAISAFTNSCVTYERKRKKLSAQIDGKDSPGGDIKTIPVADTGGVLPKTILGFEYSVFAPAAVLILMQTGLCGIMAFLAPFAKWKGFGNPGLYYTVSAIGMVLSRTFFGKVADKRGADVVLIPGLLLLTACLAILPSVNSITALVAMALPIGLSQGAIQPSLNSIMFKRCSPARRGTASGAYFAAIDLGYAIGAPVLGALADAFDFRFTYWAAAVFIALSLALYLLISTDRQYYKKHERI